MGKEFKRLKRYNATWRMLRTMILGLSLVFLSLGALLALDKMHVIQADKLHYVVALAVTLVAMAVYALIQRKTDQAIAEKIDKEHHLRERVQTMVEDRDQDTAMLQVQREDTEARLKAVRRFGQKRLTLAAHFVLLLLAFGVFAVGVVLPVQAVPQPTQPTEPPYEASEWQKAALEELIAHVEASDMLATAKEPVVAELWELRDALDTKLTSKNVQLLVVDAIRLAYKVTDEVNSNDEIHDVIQRKVLHDQADELAYALGAIGNKDREGHIAAIGEVLAREDMLPSVLGLALMLEDALTSVVGFDANDPLYAATAAFAQELKPAGEAEAQEDLENAKKYLGVAVNNLKNAANLALTQQDWTKEECVYVVDTLCDIFEIPANMRPADPDETFDSGNNEKVPEANGGGLGTGQMQYAGNDQIYDYQADQYELYGKLMDERYFPLMRNKLNDGSLPEEMIEFIQNYFHELQTGANVGGSDEEENN